jgi:type I restriction enzyme S subunit
VSARELITEHLDLWTGAVTKKSSSGRGSNGKVELTGVKKLRELILELAVRGKLVNQSQEDEPSSELLKNILAEKTKRIESGEIKKPKQLPAIDESELPFQIPTSWKFIRLGDAVDIIRGITFPASEKSKSPAAGRLACLRTTNVQDTIEVQDLLYVKESFVTKNSQYIQKNDIVMSMANSRELVGKVAFVDEQPDEPMTFGGFLGVLRPTLVHPKFLMAVLRAPHSRKALIGNASQTTNIANISIGKLNPLVIGLPPIEEQHRIVQKVDELMALCDRLEQQTSDQLNAHETLVDTLLSTLTQSENAAELAENWARLAAHFDSLFTTEQSIDKLKQTILQLAVMGRLVEQDEVIPTDKQDTPSSPPEAEQLPDIPHSWNWFRLNDIADVVRGGSPRPAGDPRFYNGSIPFLKVGDITHLKGKYVTSYTYSIKEAGLKKTRFIENRTVLLSNSGATLGIPAICGFPTAFNDGIAAFINLSNDIFDEYLYLFLKSKSQWFLDFASRGQGQPNLNTDIIKSTLIPVPVLEEQHRIVQKVDELMALCDQLKESLNQASETCCQLAEAVVEGALN